MPPVDAARHDFHRADERGGFPVTFAGETVAVGHQPLRREAGQLHEAVQIFKRRGEALEISVGQKLSQTQFDARGFADGLVPGAAFAQVGGDGISRFVLFDEIVNFLRRHFANHFHEVADAVRVDGIAELDLCRNLVAFGHGHFAHVVAKTTKLRVLPVGPRRCSTRPSTKFFLRGFFLPVADDDLAGQAQPAPDEAVLAVAVRRLVQVHEIHVNRRPRDVAIVLRVQMRDRFAELLEAVDPHLRRREGVAPGDEADASGGVVRGLAKFRHGVRRNHHRLENDFDRNRGRGVERLGDFLRMFGDGLERFRPVKMLAAGDEPDFVLLEVDVHK